MVEHLAASGRATPVCPGRPRHALADAGLAGHHRKAALDAEAVLDPPQEIGDQRRGGPRRCDLRRGADLAP